MAGCEDLVLALDQVERHLDAAGIGPGTIRSTVEQLSRAFEAGTDNLKQRLEVSFPEVAGRFVDVVNNGILNEFKTGQLKNALDLDQLQKDAELAVRRGVENVWHLTNPQ